MTESRDDYVGTADLDTMLIPLDVLREKLGISKWTLARRIGDVERVPYRGGKAVRWGDIKHLLGKPRTESGEQW